MSNPSPVFIGQIKEHLERLYTQYLHTGIYRSEDEFASLLMDPAFGSNPQTLSKAEQELAAQFQVVRTFFQQAGIGLSRDPGALTPLHTPSAQAPASPPGLYAVGSLGSLAGLRRLPTEQTATEASAPQASTPQASTPQASTPPPLEEQARQLFDRMSNTPSPWWERGLETPAPVGQAPVLDPASYAWTAPPRVQEKAAATPHIHTNAEADTRRQHVAPGGEMELLEELLDSCVRVPLAQSGIRAARFENLTTLQLVWEPNPQQVELLDVLLRAILIPLMRSAGVVGIQFQPAMPSIDAEGVTSMVNVSLDDEAGLRTWWETYKTMQGFGPAAPPNGLRED